MRLFNTGYPMAQAKHTTAVNIPFGMATAVIKHPVLEKYEPVKDPKEAQRLGELRKILESGKATEQEKNEHRDLVKRLIKKHFNYTW